MLIEINKELYEVNQNEFATIIHNEYNNLIIRENLGLFERLISLINEILKECKIEKLFLMNPTHGGFIPVSVAKLNPDINIHILSSSLKHRGNILKNIESYNSKNIFFDNSLCYNYNNSILFAEDHDLIDYTINNEASFILTKSSFLMNDTLKEDYVILDLKNTSYSLFIKRSIYSKFEEKFYYYIDKTRFTLNYDNLVNLCIMVKNGGDQFESMLLENLPIIDRWTILDTGSTDQTIEIINKVLVGNKKGKLYQEPFINFRESRNRCLELAGKDCKFNVMLDDSYIIRDEFIDFLNEVRGDQFSDSFSLYIKSFDVEYVSNRVTKSDRELKYIYKMHEVIQKENNMNVIIPLHKAYIYDYSDDYMQSRTIGRKEYDLKILFEEIEENPDDPRNYYYLAQTYKSLDNYEKTFEYFIKRGFHKNEGFLQERIDAIFEGARIANFQLNKPWDECEKLYKLAFELDKSRPDSLYFLGIHYILLGEKYTAYQYFREGFILGYPVHCQYSLKPTLSFTFLPKILGPLCYEFNEPELGENVCKLYLEKNKPSEESFKIIQSWHQIYKLMNQYKKTNIQIKKYNNKPILCFVADGGFETWTGRDILTKGMGGSETYIVEMARNIQKIGEFSVVVFCNCLERDIFEDVVYLPLSLYFGFITEIDIHSCIISRYSEYIPVSYMGNIQNIYLVVHDLTPSCVVIPLNEKFKKVFCLTEWHTEYFTDIFPSLREKTVSFYNGIHFEYVEKQKIPFKFIYSSFPNRGLLPLLKMWQTIINIEPTASLHIYSDIDGAWVNSVASDQMREIKSLLIKYGENNKSNIFYHGWVDKTELYESWLTADVWFYPCTFMETFCITALEAARSQTLAISSNLAGLKNTIGERGVLIDGDPTSKEWQDKAIYELFQVLYHPYKKQELIYANYQWSLQYSWEKQAQRMVKEFLL
jgi:hypothetical protein